VPSSLLPWQASGSFVRAFGLSSQTGRYRSAIPGADARTRTGNRSITSLLVPVQRGSSWCGSAACVGDLARAHARPFATVRPASDNAVTSKENQLGRYLLLSRLLGLLLLVRCHIRQCRGHLRTFPPALSAGVSGRKHGSMHSPGWAANPV